MSERSWAKIIIGGKVDGKALADAFKRLEGIDNIADVLEGRTLYANLFVDDDGHLIYEDDQCVGGHLDELEIWLAENGVSFDRSSDPSPGERSYRFAWFRPDTGGIRDVEADSHYQPVVALREIRSVINEEISLAEWLDEHHPKISRLAPLEW